MRVLFQNLAAEWGGGEGWTLRTALGLRQRGHQVVMVALPSSPLHQRAREAGLPTDTLKPAFDYDPAAVFRMVRLLGRYRTEVLVVHHNRDVRTGAVAAKLAGVPVVHRNGFPILKNTWRHRLTARFIDRVLTNSNRIREHYQRFPWFRTPVDVVPNGVLLPQPQSPSRRRELLELPEGPGQDEPLTALYAGRLTGVKRVEDLLSAFALLPESSRWQLVVAGSGSQEKALQQQALELGLNRRVRFLGFREDVQELMAGADLVALVSREEGMPNSLMEAMARKTAVLATPVGDVPYLLDEGRAGLLTPLEAPAAIAETLARLEQNPSERSRYAQLGRERVAQHFSMEGMLEGVERSLASAR